MKNKRKSPRFGCTVPVEGKDGSSFDATRTIDFSKGGIGFVSGQKIPLNKQIAIQLDLSADGEPAVVIGKVRWVVPVGATSHFRVGVSFENILQGSRSRLQKYFRLKKAGALAVV